MNLIYMPNQIMKEVLRSGRYANGQVDNFLVYFKTNFVDSKFGWYECYSSGDPSQSNGIESSHKHFKCFEYIKERTPCIKFMKGKGRRLVEEWSLVMTHYREVQPILRLTGLL
jgi:hypothetical protein